MRTFVCCSLAALALAATTPARAHVVEGTITLTTAESVPAATGTTAATGGTATIEVNNDLAIEYEVTVHDLTGPALAAYIHEGAPGVAGGIVFTFTKVDDTTFRGETEPLTAEQLTTILSGGYYVNVLTGTNGMGEVRGQITGLETIHGTCSCRDSDRKTFLKCVRGEIKKLSKTEKRSDDVRTLKRTIAASSCGKTKGPKKEPLACCLPINEAANAVSGKLCAPVKADAQCTKLGGTLAADNASCFPTNPCTPPASPSGAFID